MKTSFCQRGHQVWWAELNGEQQAFVPTGQRYHLRAVQETGPRGRVAALPLSACYRLHSEICDSIHFEPTLSRRLADEALEHRLERRARKGLGYPYKGDRKWIS